MRGPAPAPGSGMGIDPVARIACSKRSFWGSSPSTRRVRESSNTARPPITSTPFARATESSPREELAHHALGLPLAERVERDARRAQLHAEVAGPLGLGDHRRHVQQRLRGDAPGVQARAAEAPVGIDHDGLQAELGAAEGRRVAAGPAPDHGDVDLPHEVAHHHPGSPSPPDALTSPTGAARAPRGAGRWPRRSARRRRRRRPGGRTSATSGRSRRGTTRPDRTTGSSRARATPRMATSG